MNKKFVTIGERVNGRISKSEVFDVDEFIAIVLKRIAINDLDVINSLDAYGKVPKIKRNLGRAICELINEDIKGQHRNERVVEIKKINKNIKNKEVKKKMAQRNGTGPEGKGPRTGRGKGNCKPSKK